MATSNFTFTTLTGTETAGWNSINTLITSIDTQLNTSNRLIYMSGWSAVAGQTIKWDATNSRWVPGTLDAAAFANNSVELGTKTTGDYVASVAAAGTNEVSVTGSGEGAAATVRLANNTALRGQATVETPPSYTAAQTGATGRIPDARYVTDALAYATSGNVTLGGDVTGNASSNTIANNAVTDAKLRDSAGLSVIGRSVNTTGDPADIVAGTDGHVLRRSGTNISFGTIGTANMDSSTANAINQGHQILTTTQKNALTGVATGTMVYDSTIGRLQVWTGSAWAEANTPPMCIVTRTTTQTVNATQAVVTWEQATPNTASMWNVSTPTRVTIPISGVYLIQVATQCFGASTITSAASIPVVKTSAGSQRKTLGPFTGFTSANDYGYLTEGSAVTTMIATDYIELTIARMGTGNITTFTTAPDLHMSVVFLGNAY